MHSLHLLIAALTAFKLIRDQSRWHTANTNSKLPAQHATTAPSIPTQLLLPMMSDLPHLPHIRAHRARPAIPALRTHDFQRSATLSSRLLSQNPRVLGLCV
jgi:hypothetical protein